MDHKTRWLIPILAAIAILVALVMLTELGATRVRPKPLPNPNGYTDLVKAGQMVAGRVSDFDEMDRAGLRAAVENNTNALELARTGLTKECRVPVQYSKGYMSNLVTDLPALRRLALIFVAEGKLAESEDRPGDAARSYLDVVRLGTESPRGGMLINAMVGTAIEAVGTSQLQKLGDRLDAKRCREAAAALETLDRQRQPWSDVLEQERAWSRQAFPTVKERLTAYIFWGSQRRAESRAEQKFKGQQQKARRLTIDLAARAYRLEKGRRPSSLAELVPDYLKAVPQDPVAGTNRDYPP